MTTPYVDPQTVHNPATGTSPPAAWGDTVRDDLELLIQPPSVQAVRTAVQSVATSAWTSVDFTAADAWDTDGFHSTTSNSTRITIPVGLGGKYIVHPHVELAAGTNTRAVRVLVNGATAYRLFDFYLSTSNVFVFASSLPLAISAGDYVELQVYQASGAALNLTLSTFTVRWFSR